MKRFLLRGVARIGVAGMIVAMVSASSVQARDASAGPPITAHSPEAGAPPPAWPSSPRAAKGAPNVLLIMTDDVGFGGSSTFGGAVPTAAFDALAKDGARYNQFNTAALCSPTRAALLTGRNPHAVGMGGVTNNSTSYPGYTSIIPESAATVADLLRAGGYSTAMFGKAHITPDWEQSPAGPFDRWPTGLGFDYFYGFLNADADQFVPAMIRNTTPVDPGTGRTDYILDEDLANEAIAWIEQNRSLAPEKPFFVYYAPGAAHTPHQAPQEWLEKFRGKYDGGWDRMREEIFARQKKMGVIPAHAKLTPKPQGIADWSSLTPDQKRLYARHMEAFAATLAFSDYQIGRVIQHLKDTGQFENTLIIYIQGDNGASAEGSPDGLLYEQSWLARTPEPMALKMANIDKIGTRDLYAHKPAPWAWAMNSPFQWYKQVASHFGGTRNGLVMSWPGHIRQGSAIRSQFHFVTDIMPTILEAAQVTPPDHFAGVKQQRIDGISMSYTFTQPAAPSHRTEQVMEMLMNFGIYKDGWFAGTTPARHPWETGKVIDLTADERAWELYDITNDYSEANNLAAKEPGRLAAMQKLFWEKAADNQILPIHNSIAGFGTQGRPSLAEGRTEFIYRSRVRRVGLNTAPPIVNRSFTIEAEIVVPANGGTGAIIAQGGKYSGYSFAMVDGRLVFGHNAVPPHVSVVRATEPLAPGAHHVAVEFQYDGGGNGKGGIATILADGKQVAQGRIVQTMPRWLSHTEGLDIGADTTSPVLPDYASPAEFPGEIRQVKIILK